MSGLYPPSFDDTSDHIPRIVDDDQPKPGQNAEPPTKLLRISLLSLAVGGLALVLTGAYIVIQLDFAMFGPYHEAVASFVLVESALATVVFVMCAFRDSSNRRMDRLQRRLDCSLANQKAIDKSLDAVNRRVHRSIDEVNRNLVRVLRIIEGVQDAEDEIDRAREALDALAKFSRTNGHEPHLRSVREN